MRKMPLEQQLRLTEEQYFLTSEFKQHTVTRFCATKLSVLYRDSIDTFADLGLVSVTEDGELSDPDMTVGDLCTRIWVMREGEDKRQARLAAASPFTNAARADDLMKRIRTPVADPTAGAFRGRFIRKPNPFDPVLQNKIYRISDDVGAVKYFYWVRHMSEEEYLNAIYGVSLDIRVLSILMRCQMKRPDMRDALGCIGEDLLRPTKEMSGSDEPAGDDRIFLIDSYIIEPLTILHSSLRRKNHVS